MAFLFLLHLFLKNQINVIKKAFQSNKLEWTLFGLKSKDFRHFFYIALLSSPQVSKSGIPTIFAYAYPWPVEEIATRTSLRRTSI